MLILNSVRWQKIMNVLLEWRTSEYLIQIIDSYLDDNTFICETDDKER